MLDRGLSLPWSAGVSNVIRGNRLETAVTARVLFGTDRPDGRHSSSGMYTPGGTLHKELKFPRSFKLAYGIGSWVARPT